METSVISDAVIVASRIERLTREYDSRVLISGTTYHALKDPQQFQFRFINKVKIPGTVSETEIWEVYSADPEALRFIKVAIATHYDRAIKLFYAGSYEAALQIFKSCLTKLPNDKVINHYIEKCQNALQKQSL